MCGLYGYIGGVDPATLRRMLTLAEARGTDSYGFYDPKHGQVRRGMGKVPYLPPHDREVLLGHTRFRTSGGLSGRHAHPYPLGDGWVGAHNGGAWFVVDGLEEDLGCETDVDSEALLRACRLSLEGDGSALSLAEWWGTVTLHHAPAGRTYIGTAETGVSLFTSPDRRAWCSYPAQKDWRIWGAPAGFRTWDGEHWSPF